MLIRLWTTGYDPDRLDELQGFAHEVSAPMFKTLAGCTGFSYAHTPDTWLTITYWTSQEAIEQAEANPLYKLVVDDIVGGGFLLGDQQTQVFELTHNEKFDTG